MTPNITKYDEFIKYARDNSIPFFVYDGFLLEGYLPEEKLFLLEEYPQDPDVDRKTLICKCNEEIKSALYDVVSNKICLASLYDKYSNNFYVLTSNSGIINNPDKDYVDTYWYLYSHLDSKSEIEIEWLNFFDSFYRKLFFGSGATKKEYDILVKEYLSQRGNK